MCVARIRREALRRAPLDRCHARLPRAAGGNPRAPLRSVGGTRRQRAYRSGSPAPPPPHPGSRAAPARARRWRPPHPTPGPRGSRAITASSSWTRSRAGSPTLAACTTGTLVRRAAALRGAGLCRPWWGLGQAGCPRRRLASLRAASACCPTPFHRILTPRPPALKIVPDTSESLAYQPGYSARMLNTTRLCETFVAPDCTVSKTVEQCTLDAMRAWEAAHQGGGGGASAGSIGRVVAGICAGGCGRSTRGEPARMGQPAATWQGAAEAGA